MINNIFHKVQEIFRDVFDDNTLIITFETSSDNIEDWDSLNHIILISAVQDEFDIKIKLDEMLLLNNVGDLIDIIQKKITI